jgi:hypothetical protein
MYSVYRLRADDLDERFLLSLKALFTGKEVEIAVCDVDEDSTEPETDTTTYLLSDPKRREYLLQAMEDIRYGRNIIVPDQEQFQ